MGELMAYWLPCVLYSYLTGLVDVLLFWSMVGLVDGWTGGWVDSGRV